MNTPLVYLAGPITGLSFAAAETWRDKASRKLMPWARCVSPLRHKSFLDDGRPLSAMGHDGNPLSTHQGITARDRWDCQRADVVLFNFVGSERVSVGTCIELGWADAARRPMVAALEPGNVHDHAILRGVVPFIVPTLDEAVSVVRSLLAP